MLDGLAVSPLIQESNDLGARCYALVTKVKICTYDEYQASIMDWR